LQPEGHIPAAGARRLFSQLLYPEAAGPNRRITMGIALQKNPLMRHWFDGNWAHHHQIIVHRSILAFWALPKKISLANFSICITLNRGRNSSGFT
jgi:hypothetical protein